MAIRTIPAAHAQRLVKEGAALIDVREPDEFARERIAGAHNIPLPALSPANTPGEVLVFHCRSGMRTSQNAGALETAAAGRDCYIVEGGLTGWGRAGLPVQTVAGAPIDMQRQVMIAAGTLVLMGTLLSLLVSPLWIALAIFVGAGMTFAGVTGFCGMAHILARMPWNRRVIGG